MGDPLSLGLHLPSPAYLLGLIVFSVVGYVAYRRGRKSGNTALTWIGVATMLYSYVVPQTWLLWLIGAAATGWIWFEWN
ncbi:hypothetical protein HHL11_06160 [Ramlibacter sp. G-1-2-2]|uniref:Uncharacterized protein n=2 Tax=Ramlibacter agri TaxID=2728837 RepID=A0A848GYT1_9BURK|nr:hypothetical protein [Ramlibacter agri]